MRARGKAGVEVIYENIPEKHAARYESMQRARFQRRRGWVSTGPTIMMV
jgi:hypothetical protein